MSIERLTYEGHPYNPVGQLQFQEMWKLDGT